MLYDWGYIKAHQNKLYKCTYTDSIFYKLSFEYQIYNRNSTSYRYMDSLF